ncbi:2,3-bisphosphoglycerate-independent phosphoglycerate mutase [Antarcticibacterium flavum]|uniref:2,3-bisphosphoglycerate-independent phosphoglycerate mutase n=1 Tax=Antarcticibacterium flavum TaxID=2058175 RepID=A0A5B7X4Q4_9FLAO|nr:MULTISPECIES: 2,3-bisphosphoglycerate-independent phosphoglycerate mutase [Antarcticibacterium]MCM4160047.1 2,3-bisphosphoglycerate-independent phosphoglycerate mutase [Antarcticibacterium sp. W02-3]QCY70367.1 2,3-bisphosphoglycerate-independent phosphoglycerate mutase [Antarcticibacterium flavum]
MEKKVILVILDGWGITQDEKVSAVAQANTPYFDSLVKEFPNGQLLTHGMNVGLPDGQMGNSEVGHMNLGAGRVVYQDLAKINLAVQNKSLSSEPVLEQAFNYAKKNKKPIHFMGLLSDGGVHSHIDHLKGLVEAANEFGIKEKYVHAFTDGRDVDPNSGKGFIAEIEEHLKQHDGKLASVIGRYYAMDRDRRWERVQKAYDLITRGIGTKTQNAQQTVQDFYDRDITDEFLEPIVLTNEQGTPVATLKDDEVVIFFNFRTDRGRQLTYVLTQEDMPEYHMKTLPLYFVTLTKYDDTFKNINVVFRKENIKTTLGEVLEYMGKTQIRIAETEKYPHVTFFFSGGREEPFKGEKRIMVNSPKVATYDLKPEMSAYELRNKIVPEIKDESADFICLNFANPDMVGHTGVFEAAVKACEVVDECLRDVVEAAKENNYSVLVIADHGNSEMMINPDGSANTAHTTSPVPFILVDKDIKNVKDGNLGDIAPTILQLMGITKPELMTQESLI